MSNNDALRHVVRFSIARLSFPAIAAPQTQKKEDGTDRVSYNCTLIVEPTSPDIARFQQVVQELAAEKWKEHANAVLQMVFGDRKKRCFSQGSENINQKTMKVYDGYEGMFIISAGRANKPQLINGDGNAIDESNTMAWMAEARRLYGGCYVRAAIKPWLQDNKYGKAIRADLVALQFLKDGPAFGGGVTDASSLFEAAPEAATAPTWGAAPAASAMPPTPFGGAMTGASSMFGG